MAIDVFVATELYNLANYNYLKMNPSVKMNATWFCSWDRLEGKQALNSLKLRVSRSLLIFTRSLLSLIFKKKLVGNSEIKSFTLNA